MRLPDVLVDGRRCLCAAVTFFVVKIHCGHSLLTKNAAKCDAAIHRLGRVVAHPMIVFLFQPIVPGKRCRPFDSRVTIWLPHEQSESRKKKFAASIVDDVDLAGVEPGLKLRQWNIELEHGCMSVGCSEIGIFD
jgi:hypothetical protein